ncbi:hypothetical protein [Mollivirus kamchatka]|nr:hypothetical protein [Mollivirus kamchatka]
MQSPDVQPEFHFEVARPLAAWEYLFTRLPIGRCNYYGFSFINDSPDASDAIEETARRLIGDMIEKSHKHASGEADWISKVTKALPEDKFTWQETLYVVGDIVLPMLTRKADHVNENVSDVLLRWVERIFEASQDKDEAEDKHRERTWNQFFGSIHRAMYSCDTSDTVASSPSLMLLGAGLTVIVSRAIKNSIDETFLANVWNSIILAPIPWTEEIVLELAHVTGTKGYDSILRMIETVASHLYDNADDQDAVMIKRNSLFLQFAVKFVRAKEQAEA